MGTSSSLRVQIGLLYALLAFVNIVFFSVMIFENQSDLLVRSFQLQSENIANSLAEDISSLKKEGQFTIDMLEDRLVFYNITQYRLLQSDGITIKSRISEESINFPEGDKLKAILEDINPKNTGSIFQSKYHLELDESSFSLTITIPILEEDSIIYLQASVVLKGIKDRLENIYFFMLLGMGWGIIFHLVFAIFVYRVIFHRLGLLKVASEKMAAGDLEARANWDRKRKDELDELGQSFDLMAGKIQDTIATVTRLNKEINQELRIGKEVQELFLPNKMVYKLFSPGIYYRPMREVSGDIYLFFQNQDKYSMFLADASGHGISAALVTVMVAIFMESLLKEGLPPHKIMSELNRLMGSRLQSSFFATAVYAEWNGEVLGICNGGHNPPLIYTKLGGFREILSSGPPLGMVDEHEYTMESIQLTRGDRLFFYTDGLTETQSVEGSMYGLERVKRILNNEIMNGTNNQSIVNSLANDLNDFAQEFKDDVTFVLLEIP